MGFIDTSSFLSAINDLKTWVANSYTACKNKGTTYSGAETLANLPTAISLITAGGTVSENVTSETFGGFSVTYGTDSYTINFGSIGVTWKSIVCYSDAKDGHFTIVKLPNNKCVISASCFYNAENGYDEAFGIFPDQRNTYRATYTISGSSITFTNDEYDGTSNGWNVPDTFSAMVKQVSNEVNDYFTDQYKLDKITVTV